MEEIVDKEQLKQEFKYLALIEPLTLERAEQISNTFEEYLQKYPWLNQVLDELRERCPNCDKPLYPSAYFDEKNFKIICKYCGCVTY